MKKLLWIFVTLFVFLREIEVQAYPSPPRFKNGVCLIPVNKTYFDKFYLAIDRKGNVLVNNVEPYSYFLRNENSWLTAFKGSDGKSFQTKQGKIEEIDQNEIQWERPYPYRILRSNGKVGLISNMDGKVILDAVYDNILSPGNHGPSLSIRADDTTNCLGVFQNEKWGLFDCEIGKTVVPPMYDWIDLEYAGDGISVVRSGNKWGYFSRVKGEMVADGFIMAFPFSDGKAIAYREKEQALIIDSSGRDISKFSHQCPVNIEGWKTEMQNRRMLFQNGLAAVKEKSKIGVINSKGKIVQPYVYEQLGYLKDGFFRDGMGRFKKSDKVGFFDSSGKVAIKAVWDDAGFFSEGLAYVISGDRWGFVDKRGKILIGPVKFGEMPSEKK